MSLRNTHEPQKYIYIYIFVNLSEFRTFNIYCIMFRYFVVLLIKEK